MKIILYLFLLAYTVISDVCEERFGCILAFKSLIFMPLLNDKIPAENNLFNLKLILVF
jgi:hypothetical protein